MLRILVIEDDAPIRGLLTRMLMGAGHEVTAAANGIEVMVQLRAYAPKLPVIAVSGGARSRDLDLLGTAGLLGAVGLLQKPFTSTALKAAIAEVMKQTDPEPA